ncbi:MAG: hypothetical protein QN149_13535 [Armatimonadota bacterium]|nr:hypothetical protein [Armatimonadota bacterium]
MGAQDGVIIRGAAPGQPLRCPVGRVFVFRSALWTVQGLYLAPTIDGQREPCFILAEQRLEEAEGRGRPS